MEINTPPVRCPICGQYYNPEKHPACPYCSGAAPQPGAPIPPTEGVGFGGPGGYNAPGGYAAGAIPPTEGVGCGGCNPGAPGGVPPTQPGGAGVGGGVGGFGPTESPFSGSSATQAASPFEPTQIGGDLGVAGGTEPVVGWLVCIDGPSRGTDYRLHSGYNYIGREYGDVRITGDKQISRQKHAMVAYDISDTGESMYYVGPSDGRNIIKLNGRPVLNAAPLNNYDVITIGTSKLIFVALCGAHFSWKQG